MSRDPRRLYDLGAEQAVLGICFQHPADASTVTLEAGDFYDPKHQHIWQGMIECLVDLGTFDIAKVNTMLGDLASAAGGTGYMQDLLAGDYARGLLRSHANVVRDRKRRRDWVLRLDEKLADPLYNDLSRPVDDIIADLIAAIPAATPAESSWAPVDISGRLMEDPPAPTMLARTDGKFLLYPGRIHAFNGEPESGKTWLGLVLAASLLHQGRTVCWVAYEGTQLEAAHRLAAVGCTIEHLALFRWIEPEAAFGMRDFAVFDAAVADVDVVIFDGLNEGLGLHGMDAMDNADVAKYHALVTRRALRGGAAVVVIDHVKKDKESRGRWAVGAQHKMAAVDVAYTIEVRVPFGQGITGHSAIMVAKDRPGAVRAFAAAATYVGQFELRSDPLGGVLWSIHPPMELVESVTLDPTRMMERISLWLEAHPGASGRAIREANRGKRVTTTVSALEELIRRGHIYAERDGRNIKHYVKTSFRCKAGDDDEFTPEAAALPEGDDGHRCMTCEVVFADSPQVVGRGWLRADGAHGFFRYKPISDDDEDDEPF